MRFVRVDVEGAPRWGQLVADEIRIMDRAPYAAGSETGARLALEDAVLMAPVEPTKIYCLGRNYADHIIEMGYVEPGAPSLFLKPLTTLLAPNGDVELPPIEVNGLTEHEAELAVIIGRTARSVSPEKALDYVFGYTCADDVSARDLQRSDPHITRGKSFDSFCPIGPWIETELDLDGGLRVTASVNGELRQDGSTHQMLRDVRSLISFISEFSTLLPGDVLLTGSPGGSGPLHPGDKVEIEIGGIGILRHGVSRR